MAQNLNTSGSSNGMNWFNTIFGGVVNAATQLIPVINNAANGQSVQYNAQGMPYYPAAPTSADATVATMKAAADNKQFQTVALVGGAVLIAMVMFNKK